MQRITINETDLALVASRMGYLSGNGIDAKRPTAWAQYGYKETLAFDDFMRAYKRGGAGHGAVHRLLDKCWQARPRIKRPEADKESPWEAKVNALMKAIGAWPKLRDWDRRNMIGRYAGLILKVADGKALRDPLGKGGELVDIVPVFESQLRVTAWNSDTASPDFGKPVMWQYRMRRPDVSDTQGQPDDWADVHPSRLHILAEGAVGDDFMDGVPLLEAGFNALVDIEKIGGGSGESFLKNSSRTMVFKFDAASSPQALTMNPDGTTTGKTVGEVLEEKTDALNRSIDKSIVIQGGDADTLQTTISDPTGAFNLAANLFAASVQIPMTVLFGQQTGRLASDEDQSDMVARCVSRQQNVLTPALEALVRRWQAAGWIEAGDFEIEWPSLDAPGDDEKLDHAAKMADVNQKNFTAGGIPPFSGNEIRKMAGFEERADEGIDDLPIPTEGDPADDDPQAGPKGKPALQQVA
jgi:hypothetical protein